MFAAWKFAFKTAAPSAGMSHDWEILLNIAEIKIAKKGSLKNI